MRISLLVGETLHPLAGEAGVSERVHSSAARLRIEAGIGSQVLRRLRAANAEPVDRGNLLTRISFSTTRLFPSPAEAFLWALDYDATFPRAGTLVIDSIAAGGAAVTTAQGWGRDLTWTWAGEGGVGKEIQYVDPGDVDMGLHITASETPPHILVELGTDSFGDITTTGQDILDWLTANPEFTAATAALAPGSDGLGVPYDGQWTFAAAETITRRYLAAALVEPPARSVEGCTVLLDYTVTGGAITSGD